MSKLTVVVIDPGHGGTAAIGGSSPNNATGPNGLLEKNLTLDLARRLQALLAGSAQVILTRADDTNLSLADRARVANDNGAELFLSIHLNGFNQPQVDGTEVWVARQASARSRQFAQTVLDCLVRVTGVANRGIREGDLGVLLPNRHAANTASCLAEVAFLTNPAEAQRLADDAYRQRVAGALAEAVRAHASAPSAAQSMAAAIGGYGAAHVPQISEAHYEDFFEEAAEAAALDGKISLPTISKNAVMEWTDLTLTKGSDGHDHLFYLTTGGSEGGPAIFNLKITNGNEDENFNNTVLKIRLSRKKADGSFATIPLEGQGTSDYKRLRSEAIPKGSSHTVSLRIDRETLRKDYDPDSATRRLEVEFHWVEGVGGSRRFRYNRHSLAFYLFNPVEYLFDTTSKLIREVSMNDQKLLDYWTPVWEKEFSAADQTPLTVVSSIQTSVSDAQTGELSMTATTTETRTEQRTEERSRTDTAKLGFTIEKVINLGVESQEGTKTTVGWSTSMARQFSEGARLSRTFMSSLSKTKTITAQISPASPGKIKTLYAYPVFRLYQVTVVLFGAPNRFGQATSRKEIKDFPVMLLSHWGDKQVEKDAVSSAAPRSSVPRSQATAAAIGGVAYDRALSDADYSFADGHGRPAVSALAGGTAVPAVATQVEGIDIYYGNDDLHLLPWTDLWKAGYRFVIHKTNELSGNKFIVDPAFKARWPVFRSNGFIRGTFDLVGHTASGARQAALAAAAVNRLVPGDLGPTLDMEDRDDAHSHANDPGFWVRFAHEYLDAIEAALGRQPIIYTSRSYWDEFTHNSREFIDYPLWVIRVNHPNADPPPVWRDWAFWQWHTEISKSAMPSPFVAKHKHTDLNHFNGTIYQLRGMADLGRVGVALSPLGALVAHSELDSHIHLLNQSAPNAWIDTNLMSGALASLGGDPTLLSSGTALFLYFRSADKVIEAVKAGPSASWDATDLSGIARVTAGHDPRVVLAGNQRFVVFSGDDDDWHLLTRNAAGNWTATHLLSEARRSGTTPPPPSSGQPNLYFVSGSPHPRVVGRAGPLGHLYEVTPGRTGMEAIDLTGSATGPSGAPPAATYSAAIYQTAGETFIVYRAVRGQLWQIARNARRATNLSQAAPGSVVAVGHPSCFVLGGQPHIVYRGVDRGIHEMSFDGTSWRAHSVPCTTPAASDPTCTTDGRSALVAFRAIDGMIHVAQFDGSTWTCGTTVRSQPTAKPAVIATRGSQPRAKGSTMSAVELRLEDPKVAKDKAANFRAIRCDANKQLTAEWEKVKQEMVRIATHEFQVTWNNGTSQETEAAMKQVIRTYWQDGVYSGGAVPAYTTIPGSSWSAAFIAWVVKEAGGGHRFSRVHDEANYRPKFQPEAHWRYVAPALINKTKLSQLNPFWAYAIDVVKPQVGDIVVKSRDGSGLTLNQLSNLTGNASDGQVGWLSHGDIVVGVNANEIRVIGGNVSLLGGNANAGVTVRERTVSLDANGFVQSTGGAHNDHFAIVRINTDQYKLPECV